MTRLTLILLSTLALSTGCSEDGTEDKKGNGDAKTANANDGAASDPTFENVCEAIFAKADADWKKNAESLYTADTCAGTLESASGAYARQEGVEAESYLPGLMGCVQNNEVFSDFQVCSGKVYDGSAETVETE
jgi:hypothetical protein